MKKNKIRLLLILLFSSSLMQSQNGNVGIGTASPDASAALDITSTTKGLLIPKLTTTERNSITLPANGLIIFNSNCGCLEYNKGNTVVPEWISITKSWDVKGNNYTSPGNDFIGTTDATDFVIKTNNTEAIRVTTTGNIGIGTILPKAKLDINGTIKIGSTVDTLPEAGMIRFNTTSNKFEGFDGTTWQELN